MKLKDLFVVLGLAVTVGCNNTPDNGIDRKTVIDRHRIVAVEDNPKSPAQVGNGEFAFGVDITGLQTFTPHYTMSHWGWHSFPLPDGLDINDFKGKNWDTYGRSVRYDDWNDEQPELSEWLAGNPHSFNLGRIAFVLKKTDGSLATIEELTNKKQITDMWTGIITSSFELENTPVCVTTLCHGEKDIIGVRVESELINREQIEVAFTFPYPDKSQQVRNTFDQPDAHTTKLLQSGKNVAQLERIMDDMHYSISVNWKEEADFNNIAAHTYHLVPGSGNTFEFTCGFSQATGGKNEPDFNQCKNASLKAWENYWLSGAAIDLSASTDERWKELERRIILSQYLMKVNEAGSWPPQESGLVNNGWYGRFHFEMIWWHGVHYAIWDRWPLFDKSLHVFPDFLPTSIERAKRQGYKGARWPKCTGDLDRDWPHPIHATLIWQQPHPVYFAELDYRLHPTQATLDKWKNVVFESAEFIADFAHYDPEKDRYVLGPPVFIVSENTDPKITINPTFELGYWKFGLRTAQIWRERLNMQREEKWDKVLNKLSPLPVEDGAYVTYEGIPDMWTKYTWEHPGLTGVFGMLPGDGVDTTVFINTLDKVFKTWDFNHTWGWDFPMMAMAAARIGNPEMALNMLLHEAPGFQFDEHGLATGGPFPYFPSNGALLTAIGMMTAGWEGSTEETPGFPKNGKWVIKHEGFKRMI